MSFEICFGRFKGAKIRKREELHRYQQVWCQNWQELLLPLEQFYGGVSFVLCKNQTKDLVLHSK
jgi:hypothetical protein